MELSYEEASQKLNDYLTVKGVPKEDRTCFQAAIHFIYPLIVKRHPGRLLYLFARFGTVPKTRGRKVLAQCDRIEAPFTAGSIQE